MDEELQRILDALPIGGIIVLHDAISNYCTGSLNRGSSVSSLRTIGDRLQLDDAKVAALMDSVPKRREIVAVLLARRKHAMANM
jgi:hypothetical protein